MTDIKSVQSTLALLATHPSAFDWSSLSDRAFDPQKLSKEEAIEEAQTLAAVRIAMPKFSDLHRALAKSVSDAVDCKFVSYNWLALAAARILSGATYEEIRQLTRFALSIQAKMKERGLSSITCLKDIS